jgi:hypothetical protein
MGLTIHYTLTAKKTLSHLEVRQMVRRAARHARKIGCPRVGRVLYATECDRDAPDFFETCPQNHRRLVGGWGTHGWLVEVWPGKGCEPSIFGLLRDWRRKPGAWGRLPPDARRRWKLHDFCKTCFAVRHGTEHFVNCHLRVIQMLDFWRAMGATVQVLDEGDYWTTRSKETLAARVAGLQDYLARMAGP